MTPNRALALGRQRYPSGPRTGRIHAAVPATSGVPQWAPGGRAYPTHRTHGRKISCIRLYLSLGAVRGRAASRCDPLRLIPRLGRICVSDTFVLFFFFSKPKKKSTPKTNGNHCFSNHFSTCQPFARYLPAPTPLVKGNGDQA